MKNGYFLHETTDGWQNLATDEYFLNTVSPDEMLLHIYVNADCVVIGKNQNAWRECNLSVMQKDGVKLVRRISGGGAVFHDAGNVNFSFIAGNERYDVTRQMAVIVRAMRELGVPAECSGRNDILADGKKFSGNAFCSRGGASQHHGTLLVSAELSRLGNYLNVSEKKIKSKGIASVRARVCNLRDFVPELTPKSVILALETAFGEEYGDYEPIALGEEARAAIRPIYDKQSSWEWRLGRSPECDIQFDSRFAWGEVQLLLTLREGRVEAAQVFTDALLPELPEVIASALTGARFSGDELKEKLLSASGERIELKELGEWLAEQRF